VNLNWLFPVLIYLSGVFLIIGIFLMVRMISVDQKLFMGEGNSLHEYLVSSAIAGACAFLIFGSFILAVGLLSVYYGEGWTVDEIIAAAIIVSLGAILVAIGSLWRYFIVGKFREFIYQKLRDKYRK
jgi:hypothetical protein